MVIAGDSAIINFYTITSKLLVINLPSLNNTGDIIVIRDSLNRCIDSVFYLSEWGGNAGGNSLERIDPGSQTTNPFNWSTSCSPFKATPGNVNSVTQKNYDIAVSSVIFQPPFPVSGDEVRISSILKNIGKQPAVFTLNLYEDTDLDSLKDLILESVDSVSLYPGDSSLITFEFIIPVLNTMRGFEVIAEFGPDEDTTNNAFYTTISPGFPSGSVLVNEIG